MLTGIIKQLSSQFILIDVHGVGYGVSVPSEHAFIKDKPTTVYIYFHFNAEQGIQLFGFEQKHEKIAFSQIISCSGIGPKIGLAILSQISAEQFFQAITLSDHKALSAINGIGQKKAESMIMQLKDKVGKMNLDFQTSGGTSNIAAIKQVTEALQSLNYSRIEIAQALDHIKEQGLQNGTFDEMLRKALSHLAKRL